MAKLLFYGLEDGEVEKGLFWGVGFLGDLQKRITGLCRHLPDCVPLQSRKPVPSLFFILVINYLIGNTNPDITFSMAYWAISPNHNKSFNCLNFTIHTFRIWTRSFFIHHNIFNRFLKRKIYCVNRNYQNNFFLLLGVEVVLVVP